MCLFYLLLVYNFGAHVVSSRLYKLLTILSVPPYWDSQLKTNSSGKLLGPWSLGGGGGGGWGGHSPIPLFAADAVSYGVPRL